MKSGFCSYKKILASLYVVVNICVLGVPLLHAQTPPPASSGPVTPDVAVATPAVQLRVVVPTLNQADREPETETPRMLSTKYTVQPGDVLGSISEKFGITLEKLISDNDIPNPQKIYPGQVLLIKKSIDLPVASAEKVAPTSDEKEFSAEKKVSPPLAQPTTIQSPEATKPAIQLPRIVPPVASPVPLRSVKNEVLDRYDNNVLEQRYNQYVESKRVGSLLESMAQASKQRKEISVALGETRVFKNYVDIKKVAIGNPDVADTIMIDPQQMLINAKKGGATTLTVIDSQGRQDVYYIVVSQKSSVVQAVPFRLKHLKLKTRGNSGGIENRAALVDALSNSLKSLVEDKNFTIFPDLNLILVQGTTEEIKRVQDLLEKVDRPYDQILIEAQIAEVDRDKSDSLKFSSEGSAGNTSGKFNNLDGGVFTYSYNTVYNLMFNQKLQALVSDGKAKLLASPKILVQSGETSKMEVIQSIPFVQIIDNKPVVNFYDAGVVLAVFPQSNANGTITSFVSAEASSLANEVYQGYPSIQRRDASTVMTVEDGQTMVIAGLVRENKFEVVNKIPLLGDIPIIGSFFTSTEKKSNSVELVISLTQHVIN